MAIINATASGNISNTAAVLGGITPQPGDTIRAGTFTVDLNINLTGIRFESNSTGFFRIRQTEIDGNSGLITLTDCDFVANSSTPCLQCSHNSGTVTVRDMFGIASAAASNGGTGNFVGRTATNQFLANNVSSAFSHSGSGTANITNAKGGPFNHNYGAINSGLGTLNVVNSMHGVGFGAGGVNNSSGGTVNVTNSYGGDNAGNASNYGSVQNGSGTLNVTNAYAGDLSSAPAVQNNSTSGFVYVENAYGNNYGPGGLTVLSYAVTGGTGSAAQRTFVRRLFCGPYGAFPVSGSVLLNPGTNNVFQFRLTPNGATKTLVDSSLASNVPAPANVRAGTVYDNGDKVGTLAVPAANQTAAGVPVDNTVGTAVLTTAGVSSALTPVTEQLDDIETTLATIQAKTDTIGTVDLTPVTEQLDDIETTLGEIQAQTSLIGTGSVSIQSPVNQTGELQTLIVGDAYQLAAGRAITINVLNVAAGLQTILAAGATVHLGFRSFGKSRQSPDFRRYEFAGTIVSVAATTVVRFELTTNQTKGIIPGAYDYDIEFRQSGNYVTSVSNVEDVPMSWRESSTTLPA
jgi:hypothetical protein